MELTELLSLHRKTYIDYFNQTKQKSDGPFEVLLEAKNEESEELYRLYRFDKLEENENGGFNIIEFNNDIYKGHAPIKYQYKNTTIVISPFFWNGCEIRFSEKIESNDKIKDWAYKWIGVDDEMPIPKEKRSGYIHNIQPIIKEDNGYMIAIDLGTSEINSLLDLIKILVNENISYLDISSRALLEE